jgi:hypothetical protein
LVRVTDTAEGSKNKGYRKKKKVLRSMPQNRACSSKKTPFKMEAESDRGSFSSPNWHQRKKKRKKKEEKKKKKKKEKRSTDEQAQKDPQSSQSEQCLGISTSLKLEFAVEKKKQIGFLFLLFFFSFGHITNDRA